MIASPSISASILGPSAAAGRLKFSARPKITASLSLPLSLVMGCTTSGSSKKVVVFGQLRATTLEWRRSCETFSTSTLVKGHGPAMQEALGLRNSFPSPASRDNNPTAAFHLPSGEH